MLLRYEYIFNTRHTSTVRTVEKAIICALTPLGSKCLQNPKTFELIWETRERRGKWSLYLNSKYCRHVKYKS